MAARRTSWACRGRVGRLRNPAIGSVYGVSQSGGAGKGSSIVGCNLMILMKRQTFRLWACSGLDRASFKRPGKGRKARKRPGSLREGSETKRAQELAGHGIEAIKEEMLVKTGDLMRGDVWFGPPCASKVATNWHSHDTVTSAVICASYIEAYCSGPTVSVGIRYLYCNPADPVARPC